MFAVWWRLHYYRRIVLFPQWVRWNALYTRFHWESMFVGDIPNPTLKSFEGLYDLNTIGNSNWCFIFFPFSSPLCLLFVFIFVYDIFLFLSIIVINVVRVLFCIIKLILGNRYGPGVSSRASQRVRTDDWESPTHFLTLSILRQPGVAGPSTMHGPSTGSTQFLIHKIWVDPSQPVFFGKIWLSQLNKFV